MQNIYKGGLLALIAMSGLLPAQAQTSDSPTGSQIYGFLGYSEKHDRNGWYSITPEGKMTLLWPDNFFGAYGTYFTTGWVLDNKLCGTQGNSSSVYYLEFDINTGENITQRKIEIAGEFQYRYMLTGAYNPTDGYVYGFSFNADRSVDYFVKAPASDMSNVEIVRVMPHNFMMCKSVCYNPTDNHFYGIDGYDGIIRFDIYGNFEYIKDIDIDDNMASFASAMVYSPKDKCYFWDAQYATYDADFVRIDPETFHCEIKRSFPFLDQITIMSCTDTDGMENGPKAPALKDFKFEGASTSGSLTYTLPTEMENGEEMPAELNWTATAVYRGEDGEKTETKTGTGAPGADVTIDYKDLNDGEYTFSLYTAAGENRGASVFKNAWIGQDLPYVPQNVQLIEKSQGMFEVSWEPVKLGKHQATFNPDNVSYAVFINKEQKTVTKECSVEIPFDADTSNQAYEAMVVAIADNLQSEPGYSKQVVAGKGYSLPFTITPLADEAAMMTTINVDGDRSGWRFQEFEGENTFYTYKDTDNPGNDWLITPKLIFPSDAATYRITFEATAHASNYNEEYFEVWLGINNDIEGIADKQIAPRTQVALISWETFSYDFDVEMEGSYYIGIRSVSNADQRGWYIKNITISQLDGVENVGVETAAALGASGEIILSGMQGEAVTVYNTDGTVIADTTVGSMRESIAAEAGVYIVRSLDKSWKVVVK